MKQVVSRKGQVLVEEVPAPVAGPDEILVKVYYSCLSPGTEMAGLRNAGVPLYRKALQQPQKVKDVLHTLGAEGVSETLAKIKDKLEATSPLGYLVSGVVQEVGAGVRDIRVGDSVACAGAGIANHAEFVAVPRNLLVKTPEGLPLDIASTMTLGSIALQGVRRADPKLGDFVGVVGLGVLGQLAAQLLKANGCRVIGSDIDQRRIDLALSLGMDRGINPLEEDPAGAVLRFSGGHGVDSVIITATSQGSELANSAMTMCRKKGVVVIVGAVGMDLKREEFYRKELDVVMSTSYGPGRYDETYEQKGMDYPYAYVRWTENRNMQEYLRLLKDGLVRVRPLIDRVYPVGEAGQAYTALDASDNKPLIILLQYDEKSSLQRKVTVESSFAKRNRSRLNVGVIGAGAFAQSVHLPNLRRLSEGYCIRAIADRVGSNAKSVAQRFGASYATTDVEEILSDADIDAVIITTRHNQHATLAMQAAKAGKAVFVEKPMATSRIQLQEVVQVLEQQRVPFTVGFNRRFSPYLQRIKRILAGRQDPFIANYRMNAGFLPREHWVQTEEGGGRNIGEACHIYDVFNYLAESEVASVDAHAIEPRTEQWLKNDNFVATLKYADGSICSLVYTALGAKEVPKEHLEVFVDGKVIQLNDYQELRVFGFKGQDLKSRAQEKGHWEELQAFARSLQEADGYPIPLWQLVQATEISLSVEEKLWS
jgi:predicted dehydrogenase/threonine dehydrogenase-like Zn-dependent dehydrogenase